MLHVSRSGDRPKLSREGRMHSGRASGGLQPGDVRETCGRMCGAVRRPATTRRVFGVVRHALSVGQGVPPVRLWYDAGMAESAPEYDLLIHLQVFLSIECESCQYWEHFPDCWEGLVSGEEGAMEYARRASAQAKRDGWLLLEDGTAICRKCQLSVSHQSAEQRPS